MHSENIRWLKIEDLVEIYGRFEKTSAPVFSFVTIVRTSHLARITIIPNTRLWYLALHVRSLFKTGDYSTKTISALVSFCLCCPVSVQALRWLIPQPHVWKTTFTLIMLDYELILLCGLKQTTFKIFMVSGLKRSKWRGLIRRGWKWYNTMWQRILSQSVSDWKYI